MAGKTKLEKELLGKIDSKSEVQLEKVRRYVSFVKLYDKLNKEVMRNPMIEVKNGAQEYTKVNPAVAELNKINNSLIALGKDMGLDAPSAIADQAIGDAKSDLL